jgi:hypothetical protein
MDIGLNLAKMGYKLYLPTEEELKAEIQRERAVLQIEENININTSGEAK